MDAAERVRIALARAKWWRDEWLAGRLNDVQPAVVLDDVLYWAEHEE